MAYDGEILGNSDTASDGAGDDICCCFVVVGNHGGDSRLARVPFSKWFRFIWPLTLILLATVIALAIVAQLIGVGPF